MMFSTNVLVAVLLVCGRGDRCVCFLDRPYPSKIGGAAISLGVCEMGRKVYVGNLGYGVTDSDLTKMFEPHGTVESARIIMDRDNGRSKGFGFVEMKTDQEAQAAIAALNGQDSGGRALTVNEAKPRSESGRGGSGGGQRY
jgi:hypothetical protein